MIKFNQFGLIDTLEHKESVEIGNGSIVLAGLILKRVRLLSYRRVFWLRKIWTDVTGNKNGEFNAHTEVDGYLSDRDNPVLEKEWYEKDAEMKEILYSLNETEQALFDNTDLRINVLARTFGLNRLETDILHACLSINIEPNLGRVFAYLQDNSARGYVTESLVARLFGYGHSIILPANSPLKTWGLMRETVSMQGDPARLECDPFIKNWILGMDGIDDALISFANIQSVKKPLSNWQVRKLSDDIKRILNGHPQNKLRVFIEGAEGSGRKSFAAIICKKFGLPLLAINADRIAENRWPLVYMLAQRQSFLSNAAIAWYGESMPERYWPANILSVDLQFVIGESDDSLMANNNFLDLRIVLPQIAYNERLKLWRSHVPLSVGWPKAGMKDMVLRHESTVGQIVSIGKKMTPTIAVAYEELRADSGRRLGNLAQRMPGTFTFDDLVLPDYTRKGIEDFIFEATERVLFWEQPNVKRLFPQGRSLIGLFAGSPGTGKTMAAQVIATTLQLDLFRIDLSNVVSKYIGESSKNIERILSRAKNMNVVLLFDEADSLFGKRTDIKDAHDRYANTDTNYLLQAIESYPGIVILASNKKSNIDNGFTRRLRFILEFPKPDAAQRLIIWRKIIGEMAGDKTLSGLDEELARLSVLTEITGAQIKQSVLSALFMARKGKIPINISHILAGLERELAKEGRGLGKEVHQNFTHAI
ncbi:MAG: ATP-binding protein [Clostridia bacterium]|nr:ATP-binding protein [Clostridia bacterium]